MTKEESWTPVQARGDEMGEGGFRPIAAIGDVVHCRGMKCFRIVVHGQLAWQIARRNDTESEPVFQPAGFYCHRYIAATTRKAAQTSAFRKVAENLDRQTGWLRNGSAKLQMSVDEMQIVPIYKALKPANRGHTFYDQE